jgi:hypothetical protein
LNLSVCKNEKVGINYKLYVKKKLIFFDIKWKTIEFNTENRKIIL